MTRFEDIGGSSLASLPKQTYFRSRHNTSNIIKLKGQSATVDGYFGCRNLLEGVKVADDNYASTLDNRIPTSTVSSATMKKKYKVKVILERRAQNNQSEEDVQNRS